MTEGCSTQSTSSQRVGSGTALGTDFSTQVQLFLFVATVWNSVSKFKLITFTFVLGLVKKDRPDFWMLLCHSVLSINILTTLTFFFELLSAIKVRQQLCNPTHLIIFLISVAKCCSNQENTGKSNFLYQSVKMVQTWFWYFA